MKIWHYPNIGWKKWEIGSTLGDMRGLHKRVFQLGLELDQIVGCCLRVTQYPPLNVLEEKMFLEVQN